MELKKGFVYLPKSAAHKPIAYLGVSAHEDDIEIMAYDGILKGYYDPKASFAAVVTTDGAGSARSGEYKDYSDEMMKSVRVKEQEAAAELGHYERLFMLNYASKEAKDPGNHDLIDDYKAILQETKPTIVYTHNPADKHPTHLAVVVKLIEAIRELPPDQRPQKVYGCEVWRDLDWMDDEQKVAFDVSKNPQLASDILKVFRSQIVGGKAYDLASIGRRYSNATYAASHAVDAASMVSYAMDLTPLINNPKLSLIAFVEAQIEVFAEEAKAGLKAAGAK